MQKNCYAVIMAGGVGSRFWPMSRKNFPKQFHDVVGTGKTMFQTTYERMTQICPPENIYTVINEDYRGLVRQQVPELSDEQILGEPHARNTAPCVAYAASKIYKVNPKAVMAVVPSDHYIGRTEEYAAAMLKAFEFAARNPVLVTLGIEPSRPDTGYGYIQMNEEEQKEDLFYKVKTFTEKPNEELAQHFLRSGEFLWNSGMFVWSAKTILRAYQQHLPDVHKIFSEGHKQYATDEEKGFIEKAYTLCTSISIDYGILEKADNVYVLPVSFPWSDIGTWNALHDYSQKDGHDNVYMSDMVLVRNTTGSIIKATKDKLVVLNSVKDLIVVETENILLIADRNKEQEIKQVVTEIKARWGERFT